MRQNNMALWMNAMFLKVLKEVLLGLPIMESNVKRGRMEGSEVEDSEPKRFQARVNLRLGAMHSLSEREREKHTYTHTHTHTHHN